MTQVVLGRSNSSFKIDSGNFSVLNTEFMFLNIRTEASLLFLRLYYFLLFDC